MILVLAMTTAAGAIELPDRPVQGPISPRACPEAAIIDGEIDELLPDDGCEAIAIPVAVWQHLEALAVDSRTVRSLFELQAVEYQAQIDRLEWQIARLTEPVPWYDRPGWRGAAGAGGVVAGVVLYEASTRALPDG